MHFSRAELARRTEQAGPVIERLTARGRRFAQRRVPDNDGIRRGKFSPAELPPTGLSTRSCASAA